MKAVRQMLGQLRMYSSYSFQNSTILIEDVCKRASELGLEALALTDINNMYGAMEFMKACHKYHIKPIVGLEASVMMNGEIYPLVLLAKDQQGYHDIVKITSHICLSDTTSIALEELQQYQEHIFFLSACDEGIIERLLLKELEQEVIKYLQLFKSYFKDNFYICIQRHDIAMQDTLNERLVALTKLYRIPVCCSNDVRYVYPQDAYVLELLQASSKGQVLDLQHEPLTNQRYLKSGFEMESLFSKEIIDASDHIVRLCNATIPTNQMYMPTYQVPHGGTAVEYLKQLCIVGLKKRFDGKSIPVSYKERLHKELSVIHKMKFDDYFLIVFDYVRFAKVHHILVGHGRGSAAGSLVSYVLGITNVDPIHYHLLFERFLNEERVSLPDIDIDFQDDRRDEIVEYVTQKYGQEHVAQIVTFSTYGPKVAIKDLGKVLGVPLPRLEMLSKMVPTNPKERKSAKEVYETSYSFQSMVNKEAALRKIMPAVFVVEKLPRNISTHAAGVVLAGKSLDEIVPLVKGPSSWVMSQYSKDYIEEAGLLKMDFLGLKNLTIMEYIIKDIERMEGTIININDIPLDDKKTYQMIAAADTFGVFQLESQGMRSLLRKMKCNCLDDVIDAVALFRPGPMENIPAYLARKEGKERITYPLECLKPILESTYGILVYQEQLMQVAQVVAGFSLARADVLRVATSKKKIKLMKEMKEEFISGGIKKGFSKAEVENIFALIEKFANYGFNKSHSVAYGYIAYQIAYLKANYPLVFFSAILSNEQSSDSNKIRCMQEGKKYGVKILPPSINKSTNRFVVEGNNIRYSLIAIKGVGYAGYKAIVEEREKGLFKDIFDFMGRMESSKLNSKMLEALIDAGTFDEFDLTRATIKENLQKIMEYMELKNNIGIDEPPILTMIPDHKMKKLELEKLVLGIYLTMHPITLMKEKWGDKVESIIDLSKYVNKPVQVIISLQRVKQILDKKGNEMCFIEGYDETGTIEGVVFGSTYPTLRNALQRGNICLIEGKVNVRDKISLVVNTAKILT
jgi:DNA polymerase-3 subunit alpha